MAKAIPGEPHLPLQIKGKAQEKLEEVLLPLADFLCSYALKKFNSRKKRSDRYIALAHGGKAFSEYVEKQYRPDSFDWDVKIIIENSIMVTRVDGIVKGSAAEMAGYINEKLAHMYTVPYIIHRAIQKCKEENGVKDPRLVNLSVEQCNVTAHNGRRTAVSGPGIVDYVCLCVTINGETVNIVTLMEPWGIQDSAATLDSYFRAAKECVKLDMHMLDSKRYMAPYDYIKKNIETMITTPSYPKKDKARDRIRILNDAEVNQHLNCNVQYRESCRDRVAFDFTRGQPWFKPRVTIKQEHILRDYGTLAGSAHLDTIKRYTGEYFRNINRSLTQCQFFKSPLENIPAPILNEIRKLDRCFDAMSALPVISYADAPLYLYRQTGYVDLALTGEEAETTSNLYSIVPGTIINNTTYLSTTYSNHNYEMRGFIDDSQFKGCMFQIRALSSKGMVVIDAHSNFAEEKEVLLDHRGHLLVTNVKFIYIVEECQATPVYMERILIEADYIPPDEDWVKIGTKALANLPPIAPVQTFQTNKQPIDVSTEKGALTPPVLSTVLFADLRNRDLDPSIRYVTENHMPVIADEIESLKKMGFPVFPIDSDLQMLQRAWDYVNLAEKTPSDSTVTVDTVVGPLHVPAGFRAKDLERYSDIDPHVAIPERVYNWISFRVSISVLVKAFVALLLLLLLIMVYYRHSEST
jgi:hypothetical protein